MATQHNGEGEWAHHHRFTFAPPAEEEKAAEVEPQQCIYGKQYEAYVHEVCQTVRKDPSHITVNEGYLEIFLKYMAWYITVPKSHRNHVGERGHRCLFHVLIDGYESLRRIELSLPTPKLYLPPAVLPPQIPPPSMFPDIIPDEPQ